MSDSNNNNNDVALFYEEEYHPPFLPALILFPPLAPCFWNYHIRVSDKQLDLGYSSRYFHHEIQRDLIQKAEVIDHINGLTEWGGWGYRKNTSWETGYITKNGPGVRLTYKTTQEGRRGGSGSKNYVIVFNCNEAEKVCKILNTPVLNAVVH